MLTEETTLVQDIETTRRLPAFASFREVLDNASPGEALTSKQFYALIDGDFSTTFQDRLLDCRSRAWFIRNEDTGQVRIAAKQCRLRWCYHCSEARQQFITQAVLPWYQSVKLPRLLTVTLKHNQNPLDEQIDFLYKSFAKLRNRKTCKDAIRGGIWFFQVTYNQKTGEWHPHIHALLDADFMLHAKLMSDWYNITGDSTIVHIRNVDNPEITLSHNARYAARPSALTKIPRSLWKELYYAFDKRRICGTWGSARKISLRPSKPEDSEKWHDIGGFRAVIAMKDYDGNAQAIFDAWLWKTPLPEGIELVDLGAEITDIAAKSRPPPEWRDQGYFDYA